MLLPLSLVLLIAGSVAVGAAALRRPPCDREPAVAVARRHGLGTSLAALVFGLAAALTVVVAALTTLDGPGSIGRAYLMAPLSFGVVHNATLLVGELTWPRPAGELRHARLARRSPGATAPRWLLRLTAAGASATLLIVLAGAALSGSDGRSITLAPDPSLGVRGDPFPGWLYGGPVILGLCLLAGVTMAALVVVADRPAVATADQRRETTLRRASAHRVLRGAAAAVLTVLGELLVAGGAAVHTAAAVPSQPVLAGLGLLVAALGLAVALTALAVLCVPAPRVPTGEPVGTSR